MTMSPNINDREMGKFADGDNPGETKVRVVGDFNATISGLSIQGRLTEVTIDNTTWTPLPAVPLSNRNTIRMYNLTGQTIYYNFAASDLPTLTGWPVVTGGIENLQLTDSIIIYAKSASSSVILLVAELA